MGFLESFFSKRQSLSEANTQGEIPVLCPFPHSKGYETRPSAHINPSKGLFHCKTCQAEGRFSDGGLSEIGFVSQIYNIPYEQAAKLVTIESDHDDEEIWERAVENLHRLGQDYIEYLKSRGITIDTIRKYKLGYSGDGIGYPVFIHGVLCDVRTYMPNERPKMRSRKGASPLLFPFDHWIQDERPTLLVAGENDCLLARQLGFNAVCVTGGEGSFPKMFTGMFKGKTVYICYDEDDAGKKATRTVAFYLHEAGADVRIVNLGLSGSKDEKDLTDAVVKRNYTAEDVQRCIEQSILYTPEDFVEDKEKHYPLVNLWEVPQGKYAGRRISSRVVLSGKYDAAMQTPSLVRWVCKKPILEGNSPCHHCPLRGNRDDSFSGWWTLDDDNLGDVMMLVDKCSTKAQQTKNLRKMIGFPDKCPNGDFEIRTRKEVYKVIFTPDVETEDILSGFRATEQYAYVVGHALEDGLRYRAYFRTYAHPLDGQRVYMVVDKVEESDNAINTFRMTEEIRESLKVFQGSPKDMMHKRALMAKDIVGNFAPEMIVYAVDLMYHSPLQFKFRGKVEKGYPEGLIVGDTRTGKSKTAEMLQRYYGIGNFVSVKRATTAGLLGGADKLPNGGFRVSWGTIPRNNKGLVVLDEMSDCGLDVIASLTDMRSSGIATVSKIAKGKAPAMTRLLWISNPRKSHDGKNLPVEDYPTGVQIVLDLVGATEDIARFDFIVLVAETKIYSPIEEAPMKAYDSELYRRLIHWVWSRNADQILWGEGVEEYIWQVSQELNEAYNTDIKFFGAEAWKKLARVAVACAGACFSSDEFGECIVVEKEHVDWASKFLRHCYDNPIFRLREYVQDQRIKNETNEAVNNLVAGLIRTNASFFRNILQTTTPYPKYNLQAVSGMDNDSFNELINKLSSNYLITATPQGFMPTRRLRKAVDAYRKIDTQTYMQPLTQKGGRTV